tara:strand:+ start:2319 stop:2642 length:324 start_codon:yes stop_codon:yes gene_type:complete
MTDDLLDEKIKILRDKLARGTIEETTQVLDDNPSDVESLWRRAQAYEILGDPTKAQQDYSKVIKLDPDYVIGKRKVPEAPSDRDSETEYLIDVVIYQIENHPDTNQE